MLQNLYRSIVKICTNELLKFGDKQLKIEDISMTIKRIGKTDMANMYICKHVKIKG